MNTASFIVMLAVMCAVIAVVLHQCKANNAKVFKEAVERTAAIEDRENKHLAEYNARIGECNAKMLELHQTNLALVALVRKYCPEDVAEGVSEDASQGSV